MKPLLLILSLTYGADATTTHVAFARYPQQTHEQLLPTQSPWLIDGLIAGQAVGISVGLTKLDQTHPTLARVIGWTLVGVRAYAVGSNVRQLQQAGRKR